MNTTSENSNTFEQKKSVDAEAQSAKSARGADALPRSELVVAWQNWVAEFAVWRSMLTLTVANDKWCSRDGMEKRVRSLIQILNRDLYGNHYVRMVGHCYYAYVCGFEFTKFGAVHAHMIVNKPINFELVHRVWNHMSGFAYIKPVTDNQGVANYLCKYVVKRSDLILWRPKEPIRQPAFSPLWYSENLNKS